MVWSDLRDNQDDLVSVCKGFDESFDEPYVIYMNMPLSLKYQEDLVFMNKPLQFWL